MSKRLYIGNIPFTTTEDDLKNVLSSFGNVESIEIVKNKFSGRSKGFAFATVSDDVDTDKLIQELNDKEFQGRKMRINIAQPFEPGKRPFRENRGFGGDRGRGFGGGNRRFGGDRGRGFGGGNRRFGDRKRENDSGDF